MDQHLRSDPFDLLIFDCVSFPGFAFRDFAALRKEKLLQTTPFLFILATDELVSRNDIYKDEQSNFLIEPVDKFQLLATVKMMLAHQELEKRMFLYQDILESEKQLFYYLDELLQLNSLQGAGDTESFFHELEVNVVKRMELTFATEMAVYMRYDEKNKQLVWQSYGKDKNEIEKRFVFSLENSEIRRSLLENTPMIFEDQKLIDPFVQELEEAVGFEVSSLLFAPFNVLHKPRGSIVLINKIYRNSFSQNDLALVLITLQKLNHFLESVYLRMLNISEFDLLFDYSGENNQNRLEFGLYRDILQSVTFGLLVFDSAFKIVFVNDFAAKTFGIDTGGKHELNAVLGSSAFKQIKAHISDGGLPALRQEVEVGEHGKKNLYLGYSLYSLLTPENEERYVLTFMEISQTKRLQAEIIRMDRMASLGVLASGIAHEIRNPLAGIKAMAQTLEEELAENDPKTEYSKRIVRQVNRLDELLRSFFSYARPQRPNPVKCHIPEIVHEVLPLFNRKIKENNIVVKELYSKDLREVFVDFHQIEQVFFNLIINAIDAMENGGTLTIEARVPEQAYPLIDRRQRIPKLFSEEYNEITLTDTGEGMDENTLHNIYNPFFTTKPNGTGLGLSIVYQIIREHGGQIFVDSEKGKGTKIKILLPMYIKKDEN